MSSTRPVFLAALLSSTTCAMGASAQGGPSGPAEPPAAARAEARDRFDRALRLFNENDNAAALAEFRRVHELVPNPLVLFNIGLVYSAMGRPVEAVEAFDRLLAAPGSLSAERVARARAVRDEQAARVASVQVTVNVEGAAVEVDGVEIARAPLSKALPVSGGTHVIGAVAPGHAPARKEVNVAGRAAASVTLELASMTGRLAHLSVKTRLPAASVVIDGSPVGRTPLPASITLSPGRHVVELVRSGYVTARRDVELGDGATGEVSLEPEEDRAALESDEGTLALAISQKQALVTIDGRPRGAYLGSLRLARGSHRLRVERGGFLTVERDVDVLPGAVTTLPVDLYPGADTLAAYTANARLHRVSGIVGVVAGVVVMGAGASVLAYDAGQRGSARSQISALEADLATGKHPCASTDTPAQCNGPINAAYGSYKDARDRDAAGWVVGGLGLAVVGAGVALLVTGDNPHRYDRRPEGELFAGVRVSPSLWQAQRGGGLGLQGTF